jgi:hypothetical protein
VPSARKSNTSSMGRSITVVASNRPANGTSSIVVHWVDEE